MGLQIGFLAVSILFYGMFLLFSVMHYQKKYNDKYSMFSYFPYELNYRAHFLDNGMGNFCFIFSAIAGIGFFVCYDMPPSNGWMIFLLIAGVLMWLTLNSLIFMPLKLMRAHMASFVIAFAFVFLVASGISVISIKNYTAFKDPLYLVVFIISCLQVLILFGLGINPKLSMNIKAKTKKLDNGQEISVRPKFISLPFTEWVTLISPLISEILMFVMLFGK